MYYVAPNYTTNNKFAAKPVLIKDFSEEAQGKLYWDFRVFKYWVLSRKSRNMLLSYVYSPSILKTRHEHPICFTTEARVKGDKTNKLMKY